MKVVRSVAIICDNCQKAFQRIAAPRTPADQGEQLAADVRSHVQARGWRWHEFLEEDHCPHCAREFRAAS